jgi:lysophospholipase L1-like esterase
MKGNNSFAPILACHFPSFHKKWPMQKVFRSAFRIIFPVFLCISALADAAEKYNSTIWEKDIQKFEAADKTNPPPKHANLFIGSSSIRKWTTLAENFPDFKVINRGFGGSQIEDANYYFDRIVTPYKPKKIVMYSGGNDINFGKTPEQVFADFTNFVAKADKALPKTRIAYIAISPNPARWSQIEQVKAANKLIEDFCKTNPKLTFLDTFTEMLGPDGKPKPDIFVKDNLHMNPKGYAIWTPIVREFLVK